MTSIGKVLKKYIDMMKIKSNFVLGAVAAIALLGACSGNNGSKDSAVSEENSNAVSAAVNIDGQWNIDSIVLNDSVSVLPAEEVPGVRQYITFDNGTYFIQTNCNTISGSYTLANDSLTLGDGPMTEMACDNMATEDALRLILPRIETVDADNDSVVRLNTAVPTVYIVLSKQK